jgi:thioesterase domain-containing protein
MPEMPSLSEAKRALVEMYLRGDLVPASPSRDSRRAQADTAQEESPQSVVQIQPGASETPLFFLHGQYEPGGGFYCFRLARALGLDRPFYALEPYGLEGLPVPPAFHTMAAAHVKALQTVAPDGPYILGGWCNGALLAYEMARQLQAEGRSVDQLVLLDPVCLDYPTWPRFARAAITRLGTLLRLGEDRQLASYLRWRHRYRYLRHVAACIRSRAYRRSNGFRDFVREDYPGVYDWTAMGYRPESLYAGKITFIWSTTRPSLIHGFRVARFRRGWRRVEAASEVEIRVVPCRHWTCLNEHLDDLADGLRATLSSVGSSLPENQSDS